MFVVQLGGRSRPTEFSETDTKCHFYNFNGTNRYTFEHAHFELCIDLTMILEYHLCTPEDIVTIYLFNYLFI
jgi:hypothetical protein